MRPFARQSARLASSSRARHSSIPRTLPPERSFHTTAPIASENRPPNSSAENQRPFGTERKEDTVPAKQGGNDRKAEHQKADNATPAKPERSAEAEEEDRITEHGRPESKRMLREERGKRRRDIPKPPRIPDWFLKHNVKLVKDPPGSGVSESRGQVVRCVDAETGHTLFEVPYYDAWPAEMGSAGKVKKASLQKDFFDQRVKFEEKVPTKGEEAEFTMKAPESPEDWNSNQMRWPFLEAEMSVRAAFSLPPENQRSYSVLSSRVDLSLQCPDEKSHDQMDEFVRDLARVVQADVVRLDANDFAELSEEYIDQGHDGPGTYSHLGYDVFQGYEASSMTAKRLGSRFSPAEHDQENDMDEDEENEDEPDFGTGNPGGSPFMGLDNLRQALMGGLGGTPLGKMGHKIVGISMHVPRSGSSSPWDEPRARPSSRGYSEASVDDMPRIAALLEKLVDAPKRKIAAELSNDGARSTEKRKSGAGKESNLFDKDHLRVQRYFRSNRALWLPGVAKSLVSYLSLATQGPDASKSAFKLVTGSLHNEGTSTTDSENRRRRTIIHVRDLRDIANSRLGESIIQTLCRVVQKRRRAGEQMVIVGTTAQDTLGPFNLPGDVAHTQDLRSITIPPFTTIAMAAQEELQNFSPAFDASTLDRPAYRRILEINMRHLQSMLRRLRPDDDVEVSGETRDQINLPGMHFLTERVLPAEQIQRLALIAIGLAQTHARSDKVQPVHLALAAFVTTRSDNAVKAWSGWNETKQNNRIKAGFAKSEGAETSPAEKTGEARMATIKKGCNPHETRLLSGVVDPANIKTTFAEVHAQPDTINALKDLTTLSLLRPEAFQYGVLAHDRLPGLLLYGPPGTGKTLLAKAVAKESKATVLEVSGAQIYEKYVGEGEKMVRAVFSLAKKLSPCVVFIDEADAIFGSRSQSGGNRTTHREIINQFLREWDGMDSDHSVFIMVASNRPFDLDDAVLRRLPRRLLVDLPVAADRAAILGIHLRDEALDAGVDLRGLAERTPLYSGSDLKNLAVAAALAAVREENEMVAAAAAAAEKDRVGGEGSEGGEGFRLPEKRTLMPRHFEKAMEEISASVSEDMSSLAAVRKFDEQYGDRKGRRKKTAYGFGAGEQGVDESAVRVRGGGEGGGARV